MNWKLLIVASLLAADASAAPFAWEKTDTSIALRNGERTVWRLVFDPRQPKPYFHPLATVDGEVLTAFQPADHPWHLGFWWSWKHINGVNYWEFDKKTGKYEGASELLGGTATPEKDFSARAELKLAYHPPGKPPLLTETRTLAVSAPDAQGTYAIDWTSVFTVGDAPVKLDRTPPPRKGGPAWGGYGGLSLRLAPGLKGWKFLNSAGQTGVAAANAQPARWVDLAGPAAGIAIFDDPRNVRHPSVWYLIQTMPFFTPALLYDEPLELKPKDVLPLHYRVLVHSHPLSQDELERKGKRP